VAITLLFGLFVISGPASSAASAPAAHTTAADPIYFYKSLGILQGLRVKPSQIVFNADGNNRVTGLRWRTWGRSVTRAFGTNHVDNCVPNCAQGRISRVRVQVSLSRPGFLRGHHVNLCYRVRPANAFLRQRHCLS
jgi:hypothetical protein